MVQTNWWEKRWVLALIVIATAIPLMLPQTPPLVDLPGHMGRYRVQLDLANSTDLQRYFEFHWALIGNLGVDLLIIPLAPIFGLESAVKLIALAIPPISAIGVFWVAKEVHGRIPPTAMFALPFIYGFPFNYGFLNFSLSVGLALCAFGLWLSLTNRSRFMLRALIFIPIGGLLWLVHVFGWGILGLLALSSEVVRHHDLCASWRKAFIRAAFATVPLGLPLILMVAWRSGAVSGETTLFFVLPYKLYALVAVLRDRWLIWDSFGVGAALVLIGAARYEQQLSFSRKLAIPASLLAIAFVILPSMLLGSAYADIRLGPLMFIAAILAIRVDEQAVSMARRLAWLSVAFVTVRMIGNTVSFAIADREARTWLTALDHIPHGAPVLFLVGDSCNERWAMPRQTHIASFVIIRRSGFSNDQWQAAGAQLLRIRYERAGRFADDQSIFVTTAKCLAQTERKSEKIQTTRNMTKRVLLRFPRDAFDYAWMIQVDDFDMRERPGLTPIWRSEDAVLYKIKH